MKSVVLITDDARDRILELLAEEEDGTPRGLRIEITGDSGPEYSYELTLDALDDVEADDSVVDWLGLSVIIPANSIDRLQGAQLALPAGGGAGMVLRNPNRPDPMAGMDVELTGDVPERINTLLAKAINPNLARHGGFAELRAWEEPKAYILMGGGCQGCAVSSITLRTGIERTLKAMIPEILEVVDVTDHASGTNPYYEPAEK